MQACILALSTATGLLAFAVSAAREDELHHHLELVRAGPRTVIAIFIGSSGSVRRGVAELDFEPSESSLEQLRNVLNEKFRGRSLASIRDTLQADRAREASPAPLTGDAELEATARSLSEALLPPLAELDVAVMGHHHLLAKPEFREGAMAARVLEDLDQRDTWLGLVDAVRQAPELRLDPDVRILIGHENPRDALAGCAVVVTQLPWTRQRRGSLGVIGPTRIAYRAVIGALAAVRAGVVARCAA